MQVIEGRPEILYPCTWSYRLIGESEEAIKLAVFEVIHKDYTLAPSHQSRSGKYQSFNVETTVENEAERDRIFLSFRDHPAIKMVL